MNGILKVELWRAFHNPRFLIVLAITRACLGVGWYRAEAIIMQQQIHPVNLLMMVLSYTPFATLAALLATLPFADSFLDDKNNSFFALHRLANILPALPDCQGISSRPGWRGQHCRIADPDAGNTDPVREC